MPVKTQVATGAAVTGASWIAAFIVTAQPYIPFIVGGLALFTWMVKHDECDFTLKSFFFVMLGAFGIGWLSIPLTPPISELLFNLIVYFFPKEVVEKSTSLNDGSFIDGMSKVLSFMLALLSSTIYQKVMSSRGKIVDGVVGKVTRRDKEEIMDEAVDEVMDELEYQGDDDDDYQP